MRKIGGLAIVAAILLTGCASPTADQPSKAKDATIQPVGVTWVTKDGVTFDIAAVKFNPEALGEFKAATAGIPAYARLSQDSLVAIGRDLCEHYAGGFTTEDLRAASASGNGDALASLGEAAKATVCSTP